MQSGTTGEAYANENAEGATITSFEDSDGLFAALESGTIDAILQDLPVNGYRSTQDPSVEVIETYPTEEQYGFAVEKGNAALLDVPQRRARKRSATTAPTTSSSPPTSASRPTLADMALSRRQRARLVHLVTSAVPVVVLVVVVLVADWAAIQQAFFQPEIAADLFPRIITVGVKNTLIYTTLAFVGRSGHRAPDRAACACRRSSPTDGSRPPTSSCSAGCRRS